MIRDLLLRMMDSELVGSTGGVPREQKILKGHLLRVVYHRVYFSIRRSDPVQAIVSRLIPGVGFGVWSVICTRDGIDIHPFPVTNHQPSEGGGNWLFSFS